MPGLPMPQIYQGIAEDEYMSGVSLDTTEQLESSLSAYISEVWGRCKSAKLEVEQRMIKSLRQRDGVYDPEKLAIIKMTEGSEIYPRLSYIKCKAAEAWLSEAYSPARGKFYDLRSTPIPDLDPGILQQINDRVLEQIFSAAQIYQNDTGQSITPDEFNRVAQSYHEELKDQVIDAIKDKAKKSIDKMSDKIEDQLLEGGWYSSFKEARSDIITFGTGFIKGPIARNKKGIKWKQGQAGWELEIVSTVGYDYDRVSPFDIYTEDDSTSVADGSFIEYTRMTRSDFGKCINLKGFNSQYIRQVLRDTKYGKGTVSPLPIDTPRANVEGRYGYVFDSKRIGIINFWGSVPGSILLDWGIDESQIPDADLDYDINAWLVDGTKYVVRAAINKMGVKPYSKTCFEKIPGSFWGKSLLEVIRDDQDMCSGTARAIQNNEAMSSLPQVEADVSKMVDPNSANKVWPGRVWQVDTKQMNSGQVIRFTDCPSKMIELLAVYEKFSRGMDEKSGIPAFAHGDPTGGGATNTASGLSMFISMAGKVINDLVQNIDTEIVATVVERTYNTNMLYDPDPDIKGDARVVVRGLSALAVKEQEEIRKAEFFRDTNNPVDLQIMGLNGRAELIRNRIKSINSLDVDKIVPEMPIQFFPINAKGKAPDEKPTATDVAGNPAGGTDVNQFSEISKRGTI